MRSSADASYSREHVLLRSPLESRANCAIRALLTLQETEAVSVRYCESLQSLLRPVRDLITVQQTTQRYCTAFAFLYRKLDLRPSQTGRTAGREP